MVFNKTLCCALLIATQWCTAASLEFAISTNLSARSSRFGVDVQGNILIAANTSSCTLPTVNPLYACGPIWIGKLDASGQKLLFATYLGSGATSAYTAVAGVAADSNGNLIVAAQTIVPDLPTVKAFQSAPRSQFTSLYLAKISADGSSIAYATYLGGSGGQSALSLTVDNVGAAYVAGSTTSTDFPVTAQSADRTPGPNPAVVAKLDTSGNLQYALTFPFDFHAGVKPVQLDVMGRAVLASKHELVTVAPDGSSLTRAPLPEWAIPTAPCTESPVGNIVCPGSPWAVPRSTGGFHFAGTNPNGVPVTADALQTNDATGYVRIEDGRAVPALLKGPARGFAVDPQDRNRIYAATPGGLWQSENNGWTWSVLHDGPCLAIAIDPFDSNRLYLSLDAGSGQGRAPGIYRSTDRGTSWTAIYNGGPQADRIVSIAADPNVRGLLYGAGRLLFRSTDGGDTWDFRPVGPSMPNLSPTASTSTSAQVVQVDPAHPGWAYVMGKTRCTGFCPITQNLSRTQDGGNTWTETKPRPDPPTSTNAMSLVAVDPHTGNVVEAVGQPVVYRNGDFSAPQVLFPAETTAIAFDPENPGTVYLGVHIAQGSDNGYFAVKSVDDGGTWTKVAQFDRAVSGLTVGAGGVLHASQTQNAPKGYLLVTDASGEVRYGTYLGGAFTQIDSVAASSGRVFVAGKTQGGLPLADGGQGVPSGRNPGGKTDGFVAAFDESGSLLWSTYLGGKADDFIDWVLPLPDGSAVVVGTTSSEDFPMLQPSPLGKGSTFIAHLRP